ncbi:Interleukin-17 receptor C [Merluccius polli]|uniref:Interleukin-17 receptor C n=1 Tax=Merluccius polli TaxID=89951 RepID=A0AA47P5F5_MERPO|nr:Interleukin-17 receptor C [Merluccius polli]
MGRDGPPPVRCLLPPVRCLSLSLLLLLLLRTADALDVVDRASRFSCSEGLTDCLVTEVSIYSFPLVDQELTVDVEHVDLKVVLCCADRQDCEPCLQILIAIQGVAVLAHETQDSEQSGEQSNEEERFDTKRPTLIKVCLSSPGTGYCKAVEFRPDQRFQKHVPEPKMWLMLREEVTFGSPLVVQVHSRAMAVYELTVLSLQEVCHLSLNATVKDCHAPRLKAVADHEREEIILRLDVADGYSETAMYQMFWNEMPGEVLEWPKGQREITISTNAVAPCLCIQVWWKGWPLRRKSCPFKNLQGIFEKMQNNVSVSMWEVPVRGNLPGDTRQATALNWNVTAPCSLEGVVWLCKQDSAGGGCEEVTGSRQSLHNHTHAGWRATVNGHWKKGEFINVSSHPTLCIQVKLHGSHSDLEPHCPFAAPRRRWNLLIFIGLLLVCVSILGAYFVQGLLKGYAWRWFKEGDVKGVIAGSHVVLLHQADGEPALTVLLSRLGVSLQTLGFSVSLDLWSQKELSVLGPVPWLHSQLDRVQRQGGKVVLVLTQSAWARADEWGSQGWERGGAKSRESRAGGGEEEGVEGGGKGGRVTSKHVDAFSASLSCVLADYMQGRAGKRFVLVQFESLPPQWPGSDRPLPELFRGLCLHCLPSQSLAFLTDLAGGRHSSSASARRKKAWKLRMASRVLAKGLMGPGVSVLRLAGLPQDCVGVVEEETWETVPLRPYSTTPPTSPDTTSPKEAGVEWPQLQGAPGRTTTSSCVLPLAELCPTTVQVPVPVPVPADEEGHEPLMHFSGFGLET